MRLPLITWLLWCLSTGAGLAQGTIRFDWNGNQNQVHGGFDVTWQEFYGYTTWGSPVLLNSITFTDFYGVVMSPAQNPCDIWGRNDSQGWSFAIVLWDYNRGVDLHVMGNQWGGAISLLRPTWAERLSGGRMGRGTLIGCLSRTLPRCLGLAWYV